MPKCRLYGIDVSQSRFLMRPPVQKAVKFAEKAHEGQRRKTGDPYITHCIHTALILEDLMDASLQDARCEMAVICAVLHDVLDDTRVTYEHIHEEFGAPVATAVRQISKMSCMVQELRRHRRRNVYSSLSLLFSLLLQSNGHVMDKDEREKEDSKLRDMILRSLKDPLVLAVKLADRLHNLRTIYAIKPEKQKAVAQETQKIFCTLAERLGLLSLKPQEFRDVYQRVQLMWKSEKIKPTTHKTKADSLDMEERKESGEISRKHSKELLQLVTPFTAVRCTCLPYGSNGGSGLHFLQKCAEKLLYEIRMMSFSAGLDIDVIGRVKSLYSTYQKAKKKGTCIEEIYDLLGLRVIVTEDGDPELARNVCYRTEDLVRHLWKLIPPECDDYIACPKDSGYQSLHLAVKGPGGVPFEVQIRTASMDESAEYGYAAHWRYKEAADIDADESTSLTMRDSIWGSESSIVGHPVVRIRGGSWRDGIVIRKENEGIEIIVAVNISERMSRSYGSHTYAVRGEPYEKLLEYVKKKKWVYPGSGDFSAVVEEYVLCTDNAYHLIDNYGHRHPTIVRPVRVFDSDRSLDSHIEMLNSGAQGQTSSSDEEEVKGCFTQWRSSLENGDDPMEQQEYSSVHVLVMPEGKIRSFPRGTTAADVLASHNESDGNRDFMLQARVNDLIVPSSTLLKDGDMLTLKERMRI